ncbi:hypothetical protein BCV72DRAFT_264160 [Rhizopus microsporus var. microsporus]|uniref:Uncharacterized protein n=2 Tax=Rhizopus microsporus TaxID=58291 RepID=A0A2G4T421_RHIZD|nr:uncharacterized protein RHIMIDRAFT_273427 [Rhizopus microsporus ATCC 52813]ORE04152.1 hypothetical protein BCV72DRAFT_264160 [Rhizopus microsporus var. microsporus]PHZ15763.1 hypothetical protein RHIMIDRAFT_273427 [Rhizopus microsporus ATCC 52813]
MYTIYQQDLYLFQTESLYYQDSDEEEPILVTQNLDQDQYEYEFPPKSYLEALSYLDEGDSKYSFFDPSSFTVTALLSVDQDHMSWHETTMVDDGRLSPLQLPAQRPRELSCESASTVKQMPVRPSFFLANQVTQTRSNSEQDMDIFCSESVPVMDFDSSTMTDTLKTNESRIILVRLNRNKYNAPITIIQQHYTENMSDEGYDDNEKDEELESDCQFYSILQDDEELIRDKAAIKIQSLWRGYNTRRNMNQPKMLFHIAALCDTINRRQYENKVNQLENKLKQLEQRLEQETAMRRAFENTVEDMTVLIDQQQKVLYDRLEEEVSLRQTYELKMNEALDQTQALEYCLKKEVTARTKMEDMLTRILDQMHETETARLQQTQQDAEERRLIQSKLDQALNEISQLKKMNMSTRKDPVKKTSNVISVAKATKTPIGRHLSSVTATGKNSPVMTTERPSVVPSNRRSTTTTTTNTTNNTTLNSTKKTLLVRK